MEVSIIVAMTPQGLIGINNKIPWHLPADLQRFKKITMGHPINYIAEGCTVITNWAQLEILIDGKAFVIGGADIYNYALPIAQYLYITIVHAELEGDIYFPDWNQKQWHEVEREFREKDEKNMFDVDNVLYERSI
jgi:dihydrofolate reductase